MSYQSIAILHFEQVAYLFLPSTLFCFVFFLINQEKKCSKIKLIFEICVQFFAEASVSFVVSFYCYIVCLCFWIRCFCCKVLFCVNQMRLILHFQSRYRLQVIVILCICKEAPGLLKSAEFLSLKLLIVSCNLIVTKEFSL